MTIELLNRQVKFKISDIYFPDSRRVMTELYGERILAGRVLEITQNDRGARFAVVEVNKLQNLIVVALEHITQVGSEDKAGKEA